MPKDDKSCPDIEVFYSLESSLRAGDHVEVYDSSGIVNMGGMIETIAPHLGILWIQTDAGERRLLDLQEHSVRPRRGTRSPDWHYLVT